MKSAVCLVIVCTCVSLTLAVTVPKDQCTVLSKECEDCVCGQQQCVERVKCCTYVTYQGWQCHLSDVLKNGCCPFECQNGGTRVPLVGTTVSMLEVLVFHC